MTGYRNSRVIGGLPVYVGDRLQVRSLKAKPHYNGVFGTVQSLYVGDGDPGDQSRLGVLLEDDGVVELAGGLATPAGSRKVLSLRPENLKFLSADYDEERWQKALEAERRKDEEKRKFD